MMFASNFGRDSRHNVAASNENQSIVDANKFNSKLVDMNAPFNDKLPPKSGFGAKFTPVNQTNLIKNDFHEEEEEQKLVKFLTEHPNHFEWKTSTPESTIRNQKPRTEDTNRRDRLERQIAKLILNETPHFELQDLDLDKHDICELSTKEILQDLVASSNVTPPSSIRFSENSQGRDADHDSLANPGPTRSDKFEFLSLGKSPSKASDSDIFSFNKEDDDWAVFGDSSMMNVPLLPSQELDENGFRVSFGADVDEDVKSNGEVETSEAVSSETILRSTEKKDSEKQKPQLPFSRDSIIAGHESSTITLYLTGSSSESSCKFEVPQSPSSVTNFAPEDRKSPGR
eukprot:CAMPEP_0172372910 /NCGR_PEP_ID=MMETSP1060-20121228/49711_1 /TAXON_ID=37318 /ORGANISM="Pseudo-nitzschia pungens, Strain cf. cingulata" /LENGTH=342 /DNA_ID=CAMNT_0013099073 /DNA_START=70 /DNA_END=1095 /DNA_ORIENTATION=+